MVLEDFCPKPSPHHERFRFLPCFCESFAKSDPAEPVGNFPVGFHVSVVLAYDYGAVFVLAFVSLRSEVVECPNFSERHAADAEFYPDATGGGFRVRLVARLQP